MNRFGYMKVAGAIPSVRVADCRYNAGRIERMIRRAAEEGAELVAFPELSLTGYTCGDLFGQPALVRAAEEALGRLVAATADCPVCVVAGLPVASGPALYNCAAAFAEGEILGVVPKSYIPNYSEFYEARWFAPGTDVRGNSLSLCGQEVPFGVDLLLKINGVECGIEICEDLWVPAPPSVDLVLAGAKLIVNLSASPEQAGKYDYLRSLAVQQSARLRAGYLYVGAGFGESSTDLVFAGNILAADQGRELAASERFSMEEQLLTAEIDVEQIATERCRATTFRPQNATAEYTLCECEFAVKEQPLQRAVDPTPFVPADPADRDIRCEEILNIQSSGLAQRLGYTKCRNVVIGISGGLDSTLALLVAVRTFDRMGLDRKGIHGITMPGFGTTGRTYRNALELMRQLGVTLHEIPIVKAVEQHFADIGLPAGDRSATYENSQARERTQILMDYANKVGGLVIGTGDLSELALGWATYNGDHMSMYGVNGSVPKTLVRHLVRWAADRETGAARATLLDIIDTPVSPELLPADEKGGIAQKTEDLVGPYELHDFFLYHFIRRGFAPEKLLMLAERAFAGRYPREVILKWMHTFFRRFFAQQFKRSALPDGPKVGSVSLSPRGDWRMPSDASAALWLEEVERLKEKTGNSLT